MNALWFLWCKMQIVNKMNSLSDSYSETANKTGPPTNKWHDILHVWHLPSTTLNMGPCKASFLDNLPLAFNMLAMWCNIWALKPPNLYQSAYREQGGSLNTILRVHRSLLSQRTVITDFGQPIILNPLRPLIHTNTYTVHAWGRPTYWIWSQSNITYYDINRVSCDHQFTAYALTSIKDT